MLTLIQEAVLIKISHSINNALADLHKTQDSDLYNKIDRLNKKRILVKVKSFPFELAYIIIFKDRKIELTSDGATEVIVNNDSAYDLTINLSLGGLIRSRLTSIEQVIRDRDIEFTGDLNIAMELQSLLNNTDINLRDILQEKLSEQTSDAFAWQFINIIDKILTRITVKHGELAEQISEYLQTEKNILVNKIEVEHFIKDVDNLRDDVARLEARIDRL